MRDPLCPSCEKTGMSKEEREALVRQSRSLLAPSDCCSDKGYEERLRVCNSCEGLLPSETCGYCGCFVHIRALKKDASCPYPGENKWSGLS